MPRLRWDKALQNLSSGLMDIYNIQESEKARKADEEYRQRLLFNADRDYKFKEKKYDDTRADIEAAKKEEKIAARKKRIAERDVALSKKHYDIEEPGVTARLEDKKKKAAEKKKQAELERDPKYWEGIWYQGGQVPQKYATRFEAEATLKQLEVDKKAKELESKSPEAEPTELSLETLRSEWSKMDVTEKSDYDNSFGKYVIEQRKDLKKIDPIGSERFRGEGSGWSVFGDRGPATATQAPPPQEQILQPQIPDTGDPYNNAIIGMFDTIPPNRINPGMPDPMAAELPPVPTQEELEEEERTETRRAIGDTLKKWGFKQDPVVVEIDPENKMNPELSQDEEYLTYLLEKWDMSQRSGIPLDPVDQATLDEYLIRLMASR